MPKHRQLYNADGNRMLMQHRITHKERQSRIVIAIQRSNKTQAEIAVELGVTAKNVSNWKTSGSMHTKMLLPFAQATGVTTDWLLGCDIADLYLT